MSEPQMTDALTHDETHDVPQDASLKQSPTQEVGEPAAGVLGALRRHPIRAGIGLIALVAAFVTAALWYLHARHYESTDDAFIDGRPIYVDLQVSGVIEDVPVTDNQIVKTGDLLVRNVRAQIYQQSSNIGQSGRTVVEAQAALDFSKQENARYQDLLEKGAGTKQRAQQSASDLDSKLAGLSSSQFGQSGAERQLLVLDAQRKNAEAQLTAAKAQKATADASRTELRATTEGRITRLTAIPGQLATPGKA